MELDYNSEINHLDEILKTHLIELKSQLEENELVYGIHSTAMSSLYIPKDPDYFMKDRKLDLQRFLNIPNEKRKKILIEYLQLESNSCESLEYTDKTIPLLANQYFHNRMERLAIMKHSLMLRWKRFCINKPLRDHIDNEYHERLKTIENEYCDLKARTLRLKVVKEGYICNTDQGIDDITVDDMMTYLKGLTSHLYHMRYMTQVIRVLQWVSTKFRKKKKEPNLNETLSVSKSEKSTRFDVASESSYKSDFSKVTAARHSEAPCLVHSSIDPSTAHGGGMAIDEKNLNMPLHTNNIINFSHILKSLCQVYSVEMDINNVDTAADEMELYSMVNRRFKIVFAIQEQMRTFKVYDKSDGGADRWGMDSNQRALLKPSTWMSHNPFKPKINLVVSKYMNYLYSQQLIDEFLFTASTFAKKSHCEDTQSNLRHHALIIQHLPVVHNTSVISNPKGFTIADIFKLIYNKSQFTVKSFSADDENADESHGDEDSYKFTETLQMLGLDDCAETKDDPSSVQGAYLSYLSLRFLKTRDLQRTCISIFNYFRSIERTLVINNIGFSKAELSRPQKRSTDDADQDNSNQNLGNHHYLRDNMDDFRISDEDCIKFEGVTNHDDFYFHEDGRIHIKDQMNYWIIYDIAIQDFEQLEEDLILIGSFYITMDKDYRLTSLFNRKRSQSETDRNASFITEYGHREVDRYGVLYDLWNQHTEYMQVKMQLVDMYMEVYNSIYGKADRHKVAQIITDIIYRKPRLDITQNYFITSYRLECQIMRCELKIIEMVLEKEKIRIREYENTECNDNSDGYKIIKKLLIHTNTDESILNPIYILEFVPSLAMIIQVKKSLEYSCSTYKTNLEILNVYNDMKRELEYLRMIVEEVSQIDVFNGNWYKENLLSSLLSTSFMDNPIAMSKIGEQYAKYIEGKNTRGEKKTRKLKMVKEFGRLMELISVRFRLIDSLWECQYLTTIYKSQATNLGYDDNHVYMRLLPFETAVRNEVSENYKPLLYVSSVQDDDAIVDKYIPPFESLAIHEFDVIHVGRLNFSRESNVLNAAIGKGLEELQFTLKVQHCHQNSLAVGILLCDVCRPSVYTLCDGVVETPVERTDTVTGQSASYNLPINLQNGPIPLALEKNRAKEMAKYDFYPEAFFSLQLEKSPIRDKMLNNFLKKYPNASKLTPVEYDKVKREGIDYFLNSFFERVTHVALKTELIAYYNSMNNILKTMPDISNMFFQFGNDTKPDDMSQENQGNFDIDPHVLRNRARKVISDDGRLLNIWYIPHFTEILFMFRQMDDVIANKILSDLLRLTMAFHDIVHFLIGLWNLAFDNIRVSEKIKSEVMKNYGISQEPNSYNIIHEYHFDPSCPTDVFMDYENTSTFQLKKEFIDLENQIGNLKDPGDIEEVIKLLNVRKNYHYFYLDTFVTSILPEVLLASNRHDVYEQLEIGRKSTLIMLENHPIPSYLCIDMNIPLPLVSGDVATEMFPWRSILNKSGPFIINFDTWINISESIQLCFAAIADIDKPLIQDQFYTFNLLIEEILLEHGINHKNVKELEPQPDFYLLSTKFEKRDKREDVIPRNPRANGAPADITTKVVRHSISSKEENSQETHASHYRKYASITRNPIEAYDILVKYFLDTKKFNILKYMYCCKKMNIPKIDTPEKYRAMTKIFRRDILFPQLRKLSEELFLPSMYYYGPISENDVIVYPNGVSHSFIDKKLTESLITEIQKIMINEIQWKIIMELHKVIKARNYDGKEGEFKQFEVIKRYFNKPNLLVVVSNKIEILFGNDDDIPVDKEIEENPFREVNDDNVVNVDNEDKEDKDKVEDKSIKGENDDKNEKDDKYDNADNKLQDDNEDSEKDKLAIVSTEEVEDEEPKIIYVKFNKKLLNDCIQHFAISVQHYQRETYESLAMYFENILKHQQQLLKQNDKVVKELREQINLKEQSITVEKQFIMAEKAASLIMEINILRAKLKERTKLESKQLAKVKKDISLEYKFTVRNLYSLAFEQMSHMKIAVSRFGCEIFQQINDTRTYAFNELNKVKEKSGAKITADDELLSRNVAINNQLNKSRQANSHIMMITARMKSVLNWIYSYTLNVNNEQIESYEKELNESRDIVVLTEQVSDQRIKLLRCEVKRLNETLTTTRKDLADLRATLHSEIHQKSSKRKTEEIRAIKMKEGIKHKREQIHNMLELIKVTNAKLATMQNLYDVNIATKEIVAFKSHKTVEKLKKVLVKERHLKQEAFMKVDDLISQVYEFEAAFAVATDEVKPKVIRESTIEELSKPLNPSTKPGHPTINFDYSPAEKAAKRLTYTTVVNQHCLPYTSCNFLPFRRDRVGLHKLRMKLRRQLSTIGDDKDKLFLMPKMTRSQSFRPKGN